jgi:hypothetical protein
MAEYEQLGLVAFAASAERAELPGKAVDALVGAVES